MEKLDNINLEKIFYEATNNNLINLQLWLIKKVKKNLILKNEKIKKKQIKLVNNEKYI